MKRIFFFCLMLLIASCGEDEHSVGSIQPEALGKIHHWRLVTTWPSNLPVIQERVEDFAEHVKLMSDGQLNIKVYAGNELVPPLEVFSAVSQGTVEAGHGAPYYWAGKVPAAQFFSTIPFGMPIAGMMTWIYQGGGLELWQEAYAPFNVTPIPMGNTGMQMGGWFKKPIRSVEDIKGLRMRIPGLGGKVFKAAGGNPVLMAGGEIFTALERGAIDATEWISPFHDLRLGLDKAASHYYYPGWHEPGSNLELLFNSHAWNSLSPRLQLIVRNAATAASISMNADFEYRNMLALKTLREQRSQIQILPFPKEVLDEFRRATQTTLIAEAEKDAGFKRVYEAYLEFYADWQRWNELSEGVWE
ncbi:MAG: TRAP transporter substrate-binding protein [Candidatus Eutrophobiaceae bacterium]